MRFYAPDGVWDMSRVGGTSYTGREGMETFLGEFVDTWEEFRAIPEEYCDLGDRVLVLCRLRDAEEAAESQSMHGRRWSSIFAGARSRVSELS